MLPYLLKRLIVSIVTLGIVITCVFFLVRLAPGGPFDGERGLPPEVEQNLKAAYHLDKPLHRQFLIYVTNLVQGDLGPSYQQKDFSVTDLIASGLPVSAVLGFWALTFAIALGLLVGVFCGANVGKPVDRILMGLSNFNLAVPSIVTSPILILIFAVGLSWLPAGGSASGLNYLLPAIALGLPFSAAIARLIRGGLIETNFDPHVMTAKSKGLSNARIILRHRLPSAMIPVLSFMGPAAASLLTGSVVIEQIFDLPGIGRYFVQGAINKDYTLVMGVVIVYSTAILIFNFTIDLIYGLVDPRMSVRSTQ